jgi:hypothetical protein
MRGEERSLKDAIEALPSVAPLIPNAASFLRSELPADSVSQSFGA